MSSDKMNQQQSYERYRAYVLGSNLGWDRTEEKDIKLYAEIQTLKIYISKSIKEFSHMYREFDVFHPKPRIINNFKRLLNKHQVEERVFTNYPKEN